MKMTSRKPNRQRSGLTGIRRIKVDKNLNGGGEEEETLTAGRLKQGEDSFNCWRAGRNLILKLVFANRSPSSPTFTRIIFATIILKEKK